MPYPPSPFTFSQELTTSCQAGLPQSQVSFAWNTPTPYGAAYYIALRRLAPVGGPIGEWENFGVLPAEVLGTPITSYADFNPLNATRYEYAIMAVNIAGATLSNIVAITTPSCNPPTITSLEIKQGPGAVLDQTFSSGTGKTSGRLSNQQGRSWLNPIDITLNAQTFGTGNSIKEYYVALYNKSSGSASSLDDLQTKVSDPQNGILLKYDIGGYYVRYNNSWVSVTAGGRFIPEGCNPDDLSSGCKFAILPSLTGTQANWVVRFFPSFGSKDMYTAGYVIDNNNLSDFKGEITTTP